MTNLTQQQSAVAYGRAYELFAQVYRTGLTDDLAAIFGINGDETHYGAEHYQLLIHNVFPYETIFLDDDGLLGGAITSDVDAFYSRIGFHSTHDESPDHISTQLDAMAYLCFAELDAVEDDLPHQIHRVRQLQRRFLDAHLLRWMPALVIAIEQQDPTSYTELVRQSFELVCTHRQQLGDDLMASDEVFTLVAPPNLLTDEKTSLRDIARFLLTPAHTGFFLSVDDIRRLGAKFRVPHGFGKRQQRLTNLLRTASDYDVFTDVMIECRSIATHWQTQFEAMSGLPPHIQQVWCERLTETQTLLHEIEHLAQTQNIIMDDETTDFAVANGQPSVGCSINEDTDDDTTC